MSDVLVQLGETIILRAIKQVLGNMEMQLQQANQMLADKDRQIKDLQAQLDAKAKE